MGCCGIQVVEEKGLSLDEQLEKQKRDLSYQVETNNIKIQALEKKIEEYDQKIKEGENDIKLNQYQLKEDELKAKAKKLIEIRRDRERDQKQLEQISSMNETMKNNLVAVEKKIMENKNMQVLKNQNDLMKDYDKENNVGQIVGNNVTNLKRQKDEDEKVQKILQRGNDAYIGSNNLNDENAYLNNLLGNNNTNRITPTPFY